MPPWHSPIVYAVARCSPERDRVTSAQIGAKRTQAHESARHCTNEWPSRTSERNAIASRKCTNEFLELVRSNPAAARSGRFVQQRAVPPHTQTPGASHPVHGMAGTMRRDEPDDPPTSEMRGQIPALARPSPPQRPWRRRRRSPPALPRANQAVQSTLDGLTATPTFLRYRRPAPSPAMQTHPSLPHADPGPPPPPRSRSACRQLTPQAAPIFHHPGVEPASPSASLRSGSWLAAALGPPSVGLSKDP